jgi:cytochrome c5
MQLRFAGLLFGFALLAGCGKNEPPNAATTSATASTQPFANASMSEIGKQRWARTCAMCHVRGEGGAPKIGDAAAWTPRLAQGEDVVLQHTIDGFNNMPPLGYCMDCEREDLRTYIHFMASGGGA